MSQQSHVEMIYSSLMKEAERVKNNPMEYKNYEFAVRIKTNNNNAQSFEIVSQAKSQLEGAF